jgi:hypothetical protein
VTCDGAKVTAIELNSLGIVGSLPDSIGNLTHMKLLSLQYNSLAGSIPTALGSLTKMVYLDLSNNKLEAELPQELCPLASVATVDVSSNPLMTCYESLCWQNTTVADTLSLCSPTAAPTALPTAPTATPTQKPSEAAVTLISNAGTTSKSTQLTITAATAVGAAIATLAAALCFWRQRRYAIDLADKRRKQLKLETLPIHKALYRYEKVGADGALEAIEKSPGTAQELDSEGKTAFDLVLAIDEVDMEVITALLELNLQLDSIGDASSLEGDELNTPDITATATGGFDKGEGGEGQKSAVVPAAASSRQWHSKLKDWLGASKVTTSREIKGAFWTTVIQHNKYEPAVREFLNENAHRALELADMKDVNARAAKDIASPKCKAAPPSVCFLHRSLGDRPRR